MDSRLYNCKRLKTLHILVANLRKFCNLCKDKGEIVRFWRCKGKVW